MKKIVFLMVMMLAIAGVYAQGVDSVNATLNTDLKKDSFMVRLTFTHGTAPFDITLNGHHVDQYNLSCLYNMNNVITITDANNTSKTFNIYEADPGFHWSINYFFRQYTDDFNGIVYQEVGINIGCSFDERYNFDIKWYRASDNIEIGHILNYEPVPDSIRTTQHYRADQVPVGIYSVRIRDKVREMDTVVFIEVTNPNDTSATDTTGVDTTTTDTTIVDTTTTDTTQHLTIAIIQDVDDVIFHPNPTSDFCKSSEVLREIYILDNIGKRLKKFTHTNKINLSGLPAGIYLIEYVRQDGTTGKKKIVKRI